MRKPWEVRRGNVEDSLQEDCEKSHPIVSPAPPLNHRNDCSVRGFNYAGIGEISPILHQSVGWGIRLVESYHHADSVLVRLRDPSQVPGHCVASSS